MFRDACAGVDWGAVQHNIRLACIWLGYSYLAMPLFALTYGGMGIVLASVGLTMWLKLAFRLPRKVNDPSIHGSFEFFRGPDKFALPSGHAVFCGILAHVTACSTVRTPEPVRQADLKGREVVRLVTRDGMTADDVTRVWVNHDAKAEGVTHGGAGGASSRK